MPKEVIVESWNLEEGLYISQGDDFKSYRIGHSKHKYQIEVCGSLDLAEQVLEFLNDGFLTYIEDKDRW